LLLIESIFKKSIVLTRFFSKSISIISIQKLILLQKSNIPKFNPSTYRTGLLMTIVGVVTRVKWEVDNSMNVSSLSTKAWLVIVVLQSNNNQSDFSRQRRNVHTIIYFSFHACFYPHHCHQWFSSVCRWCNHCWDSTDLDSGFFLISRGI